MKQYSPPTVSRAFRVGQIALCTTIVAFVLRFILPDRFEQPMQILAGVSMLVYFGTALVDRRRSRMRAN